MTAFNKGSFLKAPFFILGSDKSEIYVTINVTIIKTNIQNGNSATNTSSCRRVCPSY